MADPTQEDYHFKAVMRYVNWTTGAILAIVVAVFFLPVPHGNDKFVDIGLGILLGILSSNSGTVTGTNTAKKDTPTIQSAETVNVDQTTTS
jgi:hypothetical protein